MVLPAGRAGRGPFRFLGKAPPARAMRRPDGGCTGGRYWAFWCQAAMMLRSSSVILVMFASGMAFCSTTCW